MNLEERHIPELKKFIKRNYRKNYILLNDVFFNYFFKKNLKNGYNFKIIKANNKIVGMLGLLPYTLNYFGKVIKAYYLVNLMVEEKYRNFGLGPELILESESECEILITTGYSQEAQRMYQKFRWTEMPHLKRFVKILSNEKIKDLINKESSFNYNPGKIKPNNNSSFDFCLTDHFDNEINILWETLRSKYPILTIRDNNYLTWRYVNHPLIKYNIFLTKKNKEIKSLIILRIEEPLNYKIGRIVDFISCDEAEEFTLFKLVEFCKQESINLIDFFFTGNFHIQSLKNIGFEEANKEPYSLIPILFNPINRERKFINFIFNIVNKDFNDNRIRDISNWYITKGDGDQDRSN